MLKDSHAFSGFSVNDLAKAKAFYSDVLGLAVEQNAMGLQLQVAGGRPIFVYQKDNHSPATYTVLNFPVSDINKTVDALVARGVTFERYPDMPAPQDERGILRGKAANQGPDIVWFKDPAGNILAILSE